MAGSESGGIGTGRLNPVREFEGNSEKKKEFPPGEREREREHAPDLFSFIFYFFRWK